MSGKCKNGETFNILPDEFRFKAKVFDYDVALRKLTCYDKEPKEG